MHGRAPQAEMARNWHTSARLAVRPCTVGRASVHGRAVPGRVFYVEHIIFYAVTYGVHIELNLYVEHIISSLL